MFERLKAIWNLPSELSAVKTSIEELDKNTMDMNKFIHRRIQSLRNLYNEQLEELQRKLTEAREAGQQNHGDSNQRIGTIERAILELKDKVDRINDRYWAEQFSADKEIDTPQKEDPEADSITLQGKPFEYFIQQLELSGHSNELLKAQRRYINRLLRLLRISVEDPGKSITEDLRKAEKWNKVLKRRFKEWKENYIGNR